MKIIKCRFVLLIICAFLFAISATAQDGITIRNKTVICGSYNLPRDIIQKNIFLLFYYYLQGKRDLLILVDKNNRLPANYAPKDLERIENTKHYLRAEAKQQFSAMIEAARQSGIILYPVSTYRTFEYQKNLFERSVKTRGIEHAQRYVARAGESQHQLGLAADINGTETYFEKTLAFKWLLKNAGKYGFSLSFPKDKEKETGYAYEPWHWRYVTPEGVKMQNDFFDGSQHKMLSFFKQCLYNQ
ncbi:MAG: M15 family metallopeptidase [Elusimicrobiota bacterium]|jgi:D-alanyl-D-alanine carboxypeptidase|nr:M15 family metallopeptidase [Elusimicrobiota bacterium]